jgi:hypothetical protein
MLDVEEVVILKIITSFHFNDPGKESNGKLVR